MSIVKISDKNFLDQLIAKITLRLGKKPTQQKILDTCIRLGQEHFDELIQKIHPVPIFGDDKYQKIMEMREDLKSVKWYPPKEAQFINKDDYDIYTT